MAGFFGEYHHQIDGKGRVRIPAKLKEKLGEHPFITRGPNNSLMVLPHEEAVKLFGERFRSLDPLDPVNNKAKRIMASSGIYADEDKQGRILLPNALIKHAGIDKNVVTIGVYTHVEIWSEEEGTKYTSITAEEFDECLKNVPPPEASHA